MIDDAPEPTPQPASKAQGITPTEAFDGSAGYDFAGLTLSPFTPQRQAVAASMGMKWPWHTDADLILYPFRRKLSAEEMEALPADKRPVDGKVDASIVHYRQSYKDSIIALWLCSQPIARVREAERKPDRAMEDAYTWAEKMEIHMNSVRAGEALMLWMRIGAEIAASRAQPVAKHSGKGDDEPGES